MLYKKIKRIDYILPEKFQMKTLADCMYFASDKDGENIVFDPISALV